MELSGSGRRDPKRKKRKDAVSPATVIQCHPDEAEARATAGNAD